METKDKIFTSFIILLLYGAAFVNPYGNKSIFGDYIYLTILVTPILFWFIIKNYFHQQEKSITTINYAIILLSTLMSIVAITYQFNIMQSSLYPIYPPTKISGIIVLSLPYIIKQYSLTKNTKQRRIIAFLLVLDIFGVICCESRTAFLAIIFTSLYLLIDRYKPFFYKNKKLSFIFIIFLLLLFVCIVSIRTDSSYGRLVVWRTSLDMIADKPLFGFGKGGFLANYMDYQAQTISNYEEKLQYLADNISHPFNEFILIAVDYGLVVLLLLVLLITKKIMMARTLPENNKTFTNCSLIRVP